ncbi:DUF3885 domain-containing protein [Sphingomonas sp. BK580]|uniref:DUF3885 domain-containing protein n=1 Tax=Sphingomonas sp. BK580 TaxID=2586972 RepID=UPI00160C0515|nr:DUF3885 domain-containing protein [Sphingomonas sp. BK580]MBB3694797.1 hypothetical protein [Sphingomonas sp. BK580]
MINPSVEHLWSHLWTTRFSDKDVRLRFQLGGQFDNVTEQVPRFLQAHSRASTVADAAFRNGCMGVVAWGGQRPSSTGLSRRTKNGFTALQSTGFVVPQSAEWHGPLYSDPDDAEANDATFRSYDLGEDKVARDTLLWHAVALEMPIYPKANVSIFLIDPVTPLMLYVYDDRGMDVIAKDEAALRDLFIRFDEWLLDYDRERMAKLF